MSDDKPKPKPGSLRDRIAAFENAKAPAAAGPPPPRPKPGHLGANWKKPVSAPSPPDSPNSNVVVDKNNAGMSASDAKESIGKGGSLKDRMAALQGKGGFGAGGASPGAAPPKPTGEKPKWKPPPTVVRTPSLDETNEESVVVPAPTIPLAKPEQIQEHAGQESTHVTISNDDTDIETHSSPPIPVPIPSPSPLKEEAPEATSEQELPKDESKSEEEDQEVLSEEEIERQRRAAIAARMARLGGARVGMAPVFGGAPPPIRAKPPQVRKESIEEQAAPLVAEQSPAAEEGPASTPPVSKSTDTLSPESSEGPSLTHKKSSTAINHSGAKPVPAAPKRAGPPRKKVPKAPVEEPLPVAAPVLDEPAADAAEQPGDVTEPPVELPTQIASPVVADEPDIKEPVVLDHDSIKLEPETQPELVKIDVEEQEQEQEEPAIPVSAVSVSQPVTSIPAPPTLISPPVEIEEEILEQEDVEIQEEIVDKEQVAEPELKEEEIVDSVVISSSNDSIDHKDPKVKEEPQPGPQEEEPQPGPQEEEPQPESITHTIPTTDNANDSDQESPEELAARRKRVAERMAKMGGVNPFAPPPLRKASTTDEEVVTKSVDEEPTMKKVDEEEPAIVKSVDKVNDDDRHDNDIDIPVEAELTEEPSVVSDEENVVETEEQVEEENVVETEEQEEEKIAPVPPPRRRSVPPPVRQESVPRPPVLAETQEEEREEEAAPVPPPRRQSLPPPHLQEEREIPEPPVLAETEEGEEQEQEEPVQVPPPVARPIPSFVPVSVEESEEESEEEAAPVPPPRRNIPVPEPETRQLSKEEEEEPIPAPPPRRAIPPPILAPAQEEEQEEEFRISPHVEVLDEDEGDPIDPTFHTPKSPVAQTQFQTQSRRESSSHESDSQQQQQEPDDSEALRRQTIAERMAKLGGIKFGAAPIMGGRRPIPAPEKHNSEESLQDAPVENEEPPLEQEEVTEEEEERARKARIATKLAGMGGQRIGMLPFGLQQSPPPPPPAKVVSEPEEVEEAPPALPPKRVSSSASRSASVDQQQKEQEISLEENEEEEEEEEAPPPVPSRVPRSGSETEHRVRPPVPRSVPSRQSTQSTADVSISDARSAPSRQNTVDSVHSSPASVSRPTRGAPLPSPPEAQVEDTSARLPSFDFGLSNTTDLTLLSSPPLPSIPSHMSAEELMLVWGRVGVQVCEAATILYDKSKKTLVGDGSFKGFVDTVVKQVPNALGSVKSNNFPSSLYGFAVYTQSGASVQSRFSEILPGDVFCAQDAKFKGHKGLQTYSQSVGEGEEFYGVIVEFESKGKKSKARVLQANQSVGQQTVEAVSYRLEDLKSGTIKVYRVLEVAG